MVGLAGAPRCGQASKEEGRRLGFYREALPDTDIIDGLLGALESGRPYDLSPP
jgi:hypothetical protein